tara:strand:- start:43 stop:291 length:249 start_codon:yes stop_codon:yes gene_type:complete
MSSKVASIKIRDDLILDLGKDITIPFECEDGSFHLDDKTIRKCKFVSQPDDEEFVWIKHPDYGLGQLYSIDLDFVMEGETDD